jgi:hypothetical protein
MAFGKLIFLVFFIIIFVFAVYFIGSAAYINQPNDNGYYTNNSSAPIVNSSEQLMNIVLPITNVNNTNTNISGVDFSHGPVYTQTAQFDVLVICIFIACLLALGGAMMFIVRKGK